jgi:hypothetical protein
VRLAEKSGTQFAIYADTVYFMGSSGSGPYAADGTLMAVPKCGGTARTIASTLAFPRGIAAGGSGVFWTTIGSTVGGDYEHDGTVQTLAQSGVLTFAADLDLPKDLALGGAAAFVATRTGILRIPYATHERSVIASSEAWGVAIDDVSVFFTAGDGTVRSVPKEGGDETVLVSDARDVRGIAVDEANVYFVDWGRAAIRKVPKDGGDVVDLAVHGSVGNELRATGGFVYYLADGVMRVPADGGAPVTLWPSAGQYGLEVDDDFVYFDDGGVSKVAR